MSTLNILFVVLFIFASQLSVPSAFSQTDKIVEFKKEASILQQSMVDLERLSNSRILDDEALVGARVEYQNISTTVEELIRSIDKETETIAKKLSEIGEPPEDGSFESPEVIASRKKLTTEKSALAVSKTSLEDIQQEAIDKTSQIDVRRQTAFTQAIFKNTSLSSVLFKNAAASFYNKTIETIELFSNWLKKIFKEQFSSVIGSTILSLIIALFLSFYFNRVFAKHLDRLEQKPDYFTKVFTAFWDTTLSSLATAIFLGATYALFLYFDLFTSKVQQITFVIILVITSIVLAWNLAVAVFAPKQSNWRLFDISNSAALKMFTLTFILYVVQAIDFLIQEINAILSGPISITAIQGFITSLIIGGSLIIMALIKPNKNDTAHASTHKWPKWLSVPLFIIGAIIIGSALSGYIGLARFIAQQVVVTGAIVSLMVIGIIYARELSREGVLPKTSFGKFLSNKLGYETLSIEQISLAISILLILVIFILGLPAILLQWGTQFAEIWYYVKSAFTGVQIGNIHLSLSGVFIGIAVFFIGIALTKLVQSWLSNSVFPRIRADIGIRSSIKSGLGYFGYGLAALMGITSAGVDLSSLAIVFGALSLGIGFGLQNIVSNFVSGLILLVERPIKVGDWITVGSAEGTVKNINVRSTEIETFQKKSIIVPNSELINQQVGNWTFKSKRGRVDVPIGVAYGSNVRLVEKTLYEIADAHQMIAKSPETNVWFSGFGDSSLDFVLRMHVFDIGNNVTVQTDVRFEILKQFEALDIEIPFPQRDLNIKHSYNETPLSNMTGKKVPDID
ncbi:MAG: mechanosensitive ion channel family protein [Rhizobiales bacterium]|nr:mechanosensitive ion channel family protein [Hyphomicrobiales bacterium]